MPSTSSQLNWCVEIVRCTLQIHWWNITNRFWCRLLQHFFFIHYLFMFDSILYTPEKKNGISVILFVFRFTHKTSPEFRHFFGRQTKHIYELHECIEIVMNQRYHTSTKRKMKKDKHEKADRVFGSFCLVWFSIWSVQNEFFTQNGRPLKSHLFA